MYSFFFADFLSPFYRLRTHNTYALRHITVIMKREKYRNDENKAASLCDKLENAEPSEVGALLDEFIRLIRK